MNPYPAPVSKAMDGILPKAVELEKMKKRVSADRKSVV